MNTAPDDFHVLERRYRLVGTLITRTALHVGAGDGEGATDLPVLRDALGRPFIPGATLKGVVRSTVEALVRGANLGPRGACDPLREQVGGACGFHPAGRRQDAEAKIVETCMVCRVFGSRLLASHVRFSDALVRPDAPEPRVEVRDGVAIDRDLRIVRGRQKFDFEVVAPGAEFEVELFVDNPTDWGMGLILMGFDQLRAGYAALGGFTSRGLGRVDLEWRELGTWKARDILDGKSEDVERDRTRIERAFERWRSELAGAAATAAQGGE